MAFLNRVIGVGERAQRWVREVDNGLNTAAGDLGLQFEQMARDRGMGLNPFESSTTPPLGVHAVAVLRVGDEWRPALLVVRDLAPETRLTEPAVAAEYTALGELFASLGEFSPEEIMVVGIDPPSEQYARVESDMIGTLGLPVRTVNGGSGALTAGHVAKRQDSRVQVAGITATVSYSNHRGLHPPAEDCADVAVLEMRDDWRYRISVPDGITLSDHADSLLLGQLMAFNRSGTGQPGQPVRTAGKSFVVDDKGGRWGDFIMTDPISVEGDSGAIVATSEGRVVGQVVGGLPGAYTIVQNIHYLLRSAGVQP